MYKFGKCMANLAIFLYLKCFYIPIIGLCLTDIDEAKLDVIRQKLGEISH
ncbi:hypothetical protein NIES3974_29760 [Calothrix sp. NIES-3974]|nr:hypothetical protein NIES3974_29760 [Calothrix sp. NIES-3974]